MRRIPTHRTSDGTTIAFARELRRDRTSAEQCLWQRLRHKGLLGFRFRQQHPIGPYIVDFYCNEVALAIELDGPIHDEESQRRHDELRDAALRDHGIKLLRFRNLEILENLDGTMAKIETALRQAVNRQEA